MNPRFSGDNLTHNLGLVEKLRDIAGRKGCSVAQLAIAWVLAQGADIIPLVGARRRERLAESLGALDVTLSDADLAELARAIPRDAAAGARYAPAQMGMLDSEKAMVRA
jgi:aryl-alcohol dehydrogenase-like predicted oxidoreductase